MASSVKGDGLRSVLLGGRVRNFNIGKYAARSSLDSQGSSSNSSCSSCCDLADDYLKVIHYFISHQTFHQVQYRNPILMCMLYKVVAH